MHALDSHPLVAASYGDRSGVSLLLDLCVGAVGVWVMSARMGDDGDLADAGDYGGLADARDSGCRARQRRLCGGGGRQRIN
uniref:Uncharacterized protein n=1 Tax=Oryza barthii TaxID=65489 RepID=A0A0D3FF50_9ORYZ